MVCIFVERRSIRSVKVAKKPQKAQKKKPKLISKKLKVVKKSKPQVKQRASQSVATETVPRMYDDQPRSYSMSIRQGSDVSGK